MPNQRCGLLLVLMQPPAMLEEEFAAWYDNEHIPERANVPGFKTALRYVCLSGYPRYMAIYDLESLSVLETSAYRAVADDNFSPWTKRVTSRVQIYRIPAEQIFPGDELTQRASRFVLVRLRNVEGPSEATIVALAKRTFEARSETVSFRVFRALGSRGTDYFCLAGMTPPPADPIDFRPLEALVRNVDLVNVYAPHDLAG